MSQHSTRRRALVAYAVITSAIIAAVLAFLQVAILFTPDTFNVYIGYALIYSVGAALCGAVSGVVAGAVVLIALSADGRSARSTSERAARAARSRALLVAGALAVGSLPGLALAVWLTGQFSLEVHEPSPLQWVEFAVALVVFSVGGALWWRRMDRVHTEAAIPPDHPV